MGRIVKKDTPHTTKFKRLKRRLRIPAFQAAGLLEMLWNMALFDAQDGAIGKFSNEDIAAYLEWEADENELIETLVACGFLDECGECRLVIHDWEQHAPQYLKNNFRRYEREFAVAKQTAKEPPKKRAKQATKDGATHGASSQVKSSQVKPSQELASFDAWYSIYPIRKDRRKAATAYRSAMDRIKGRFADRSEAVEWLKGRTQEFATEAASEDPQFIKRPASWLNADAFDDEVWFPKKTNGGVNGRDSTDYLMSLIPDDGSEGEQ